MLAVGIIIMCLIVAGVGFVSKLKVKSASDFVVASRSSSSVMVSGALLCSLVGSSSTVGTAEAAFKYGMTAWWQTLGSGIGTIIMAYLIAGFFYRKSEKDGTATIPQFLVHTYGPKLGILVALFGAGAVFLSTISQTKGFAALVSSMLPGVSINVACGLCIIMVLLFIVFGGIFGTSYGGLIKMGAMYIGLIAATVVAINLSGGYGAMVSTSDSLFGAEGWHWRNLFSRGILNDSGTAISYFLGITCTQSYIQATLSAKDIKAARNGSILAGLICIPVGLLAIAVGLYMKASFPDMTPSQVLPQFILMKFSPLAAGLIIGALLLNILGSSAGLTLGLVTNIVRDVVAKLRKKEYSDKQMLMALRVGVFLSCCLNAFFAMTNAGVLIQNLVSFSQNIRVCTNFVPMMFAIYYKGTKTHEAGFAAVLVGPVISILWKVLGTPFNVNSIIVGVIAALIAFMIANTIFKKNYGPEQN